MVTENGDCGGMVILKGTTGVSGMRSCFLLDGGGGYRDLFTLRIFIKLYDYNLHTLLFACYF